MCIRDRSQTHPDHLGLEAFANYINEKLGDKYRVEVYPSELLGSQTEMVQLTQTGAIDFVVASNAIMAVSYTHLEVGGRDVCAREIGVEVIFFHSHRLV